jgi:hypothetical protein
MRRRTSLLALLTTWLLHDFTLAQSIPVVFMLDNTASEVQIGLTVPGSSDSDSSPVSGTLEAVLDVTTSGGIPAITGIEFTGGEFMNDEAFHFSLTVLGFLTADLEGRDFVGVPRTPLPPAPVSSDPLAPLTFQYDAADHVLSFNQGVIEVSGAFNETLDLSQDPVSGMPPAGSLATIELARGTTVGELTEFTATLTQPLSFLDTFEVDAGIVTLPVEVDVSGQAIAMGSFFLSAPTNAGAGDYNGNGLVEQGDLDLVLLNWGADAANVPAAWQNDPPDGLVDQEELDGVLLQWGNAALEGGALATVPEPPVVGLFLACLSVLWPFYLSRRRAAEAFEQIAPY